MHWADWVKLVDARKEFFAFGNAADVVAGHKSLPSPEALRQCDATMAIIGVSRKMQHPTKTSLEHDDADAAFLAQLVSDLIAAGAQHDFQLGVFAQHPI